MYWDISHRTRKGLGLCHDHRLCMPVKVGGNPGVDRCNETNDGLLVYRRKGSRANVTEWSETLRQTWEDAKAMRDEIITKHKLPHQINPELRPIFISERTGDKITANSLKTAKSRVSKMPKEKT